MIRDIHLVECSILERILLPSSMEHYFHTFYVFAGSGLLIADSSSYTCNPGSLFFFPSLEVAVTQPSIHDTLSILHLSFVCNSHDMAAELAKLPSSLISVQPIHDIFLEILHEFTLQNTFYLDLCSMYLEHFLVSSIICITRGQEKLQTPVLAVNLSNHPSLESVCTYVNQNLNSELSLSFLCDITRQSPKQLNAQFLNLFHKSVAEYIAERRHLKTRELLFFSNFSITEIAEKTGYGSVHYFSKVFKEKEGLSPTQYRKKFGG